MRLERGGRERPSREPRRPLRCLIADATPGAAAELSILIRRLSPEADLLPAAQEGTDALRRIRTFRPDLVLLDLDLPRMDGLTILRALGRRRPPATIVLAPATLEGGRAAWEALSLGATDLLPRRWLREPERSEASLRRALRRLERSRAPSGSARLRVRGRPLGKDDMKQLSALAFVLPMADLPAAGRALARLGAHAMPPILFFTPHPPRYARALREGLDRVLPGPVSVAADGERLAAGQTLLLQADAALKIEEADLGLAVRYIAPEHPTTGARRRAGSLVQSLLAQGAPGLGVVLSAPPSPSSLAGAKKAVRAGRLLRLRTAGARGQAILKLTSLSAVPVHRLV